MAQADCAAHERNEAIALAERAGLARPAEMGKLAQTAPLPPDQAEQLAAVEDMIATLKDLPHRTNDRALLGSY